MSEYNFSISKNEPSPEIKFEKPSFEVGTESLAKNNPNQDSIVANESLGLFAVIDGAGGHANAAKVSREAGSSMEDIISQQPDISLADMLRETSRIVTEATNSVGIATAAVVRVVETMQSGQTCKVEAATLGDSRVYIIDKNGNIKFVSIDNITSETPDSERRLRYEQQQRLSAVNTDLDILPEDNWSFEHRNGISNYIGEHREDLAEVYELEITEGDTIVITSDGIHDNLTDQEISSLASSFTNAQDFAKYLASKSVARAGEGHLRSKADDTSVVVMKYKGGSFESKAAAEFSSMTPEPVPEKDAENFSEINLEKDVPLELDLESIPFPLKLYLGVYELQLSLDEREGRPPALVLAIPGKSVGEYLSGKFAAEIPASEVPNVITLGRAQKIEELLGVEFPQTVSHKHLEITYGNRKLTLKDTSMNGTILSK